MTAHDAIKTAESNLAAQLRQAAAMLDTVGTSDLIAATADLERAARAAKERLQAAARGAAVLLAGVAATAEALAAELAVELEPAIITGCNTSPSEPSSGPASDIIAAGDSRPVAPSPAPEHAGPSGEEAEPSTVSPETVAAPANRVAERLPRARCASPVDVPDDGIVVTGDAMKRMDTALVTPPAEEVAGRAAGANGRARRQRKV